MIDLKFIVLEKRAVGNWPSLLLLLLITILTNACQSGSATISADTEADSLLLPSTYISTEESVRREEWFNKHKLPIIDKLTTDDKKKSGTNQLNFSNLFEAVGFLNFLISDQGRSDKDTITGIRVYFAAPQTSEGKSGKLTLIFNATNNGRIDVQNYYAFRNGRLDENKFDQDTAKTWVHNYQLNIRKKLSDSTMDPNDTCKNETKHIWFSKKQIKSIIYEIEYQIKTHADKVAKLGVRFISYTDKDYSYQNFPVIKHHQRMTICFTFINKQGKDVGLEQIDAIEFKKRLDYTVKNKFLGDTFDTGDPTPPPSTDNMAALDVSN